MSKQYALSLASIILGMTVVGSFLAHVDRYSFGRLIVLVSPSEGLSIVYLRAVLFAGADKVSCVIRWERVIQWSLINVAE